MIEEIEYAQNPVKAIRAKCVDCAGGHISEIAVCEIQSCALWPFRMGKNPFRKARELTEESRQALRDRMDRARKDKGS